MIAPRKAPTARCFRRALLVSAIAATAPAVPAGASTVSVLAELSAPAALTSTPQDDVLVAFGPDARAIARVSTDGSVTPFLGSATAPLALAGDGGPAVAASTCGIGDLTRTADGRVWFTDRGQAVRFVDPSGVVQTPIGPDTPIFEEEPCSPKGSLVDYPTGIAGLANNRVVVGNTNRHNLFTVERTATSTTISEQSTGEYIEPYAVLPHADGTTWITQFQIVHRVGTQGVRSDAVNFRGYFGDSGDFGPAQDARLRHATGLTALPGGGTAVTDIDSNRVRVVRLVDGVRTIFPLVGGGGLAPPADQDALRLQEPFDVEPLAAGLVVSERGANRLLLVDKTSLAGAPDGVTSASDAELAFESWYDGPTFSCRLNGGAWAACTSPLSLAGLPDGSISFEVRAADADGVDPSPADASWTVDTTPPEPPRLLAPSDGAPAAARPLFRWEAAVDATSGIAGYELLVDDVVVHSTPSCPYEWRSLIALAKGGHTVQVRAIDRAGLVSVSAEQTFVVDDAVPSPPVLADPVDGMRMAHARPRLTWAASTDVGSGVVGYRVTIDGSPVANVSGTSFEVPTPLSDGWHGWYVTAVDRAGNETTSGSRRFVVDTAAPRARMEVGPARTTTGTLVTADASGSYDSDGPIIRYEFDLDGDGSYEVDAGGDPRMSTSYGSVGTRAVSVRVTDGAGLQAVASAAVVIVARTGATLVGQIAGLETIPPGVRYTNRLRVRLQLIAPPFASAARISNGGDLNDASNLTRVLVLSNSRVAVDDWPLVTPADPRGQSQMISVVYEVGPDTVYRTLTIFVDLVAPRLRKAVIAGRRIRVKATDSHGSGVRRARARRARGRASAFKRLANGTLRVPAGRGKLEVQVVDQAGNRSRWRPARR